MGKVVFESYAYPLSVFGTKIGEILTKSLFAYIINFTFLNLERGAGLGRSRLVFRIEYDRQKLSTR